VDITATLQGTILEFDSAGFDATRVFSPAVALVDGTYVMLYGGLPFANNIQIGLATSSDGITWTKYSSDPVISNLSSPSWDSFRESPITLIYENGVYELWFAGSNTNLSTDPGAVSGFGYATSTDGTHWTQASAPIRIGLPSSAPSLDEVVKLGLEYHAYYFQGDALYHVTSADGINFSGDTEISGLPLGSNLLAATTTTKDGSQVILAIFGNPDGSTLYADSTDGLNFNVDGNITLPTGFGVNDIRVENGVLKLFGTEGVGNVNWAFGNAVIELATASLPSDFQVNHNPVANPDSISVHKGTPLSVDAASGVLHNDSDPDNDILVVTSVSNNGVTGTVGHTLAGANGDLILNANGSYTYTPNGQAIIGAHDDFTYMISDGHGGTASALLDVAILAPEIELPFGASATNHHGKLGAIVTQTYGEGDHGGPGTSSFDQLLYYSVDFSLDKGTPVLAEGSGTVVYVSDKTQDTKNEAPTYTEVNGVLKPVTSETAHLGPHSLGNYVTIQYDNGFFATYAHLEFVTPNNLPVNAGQHVSQGQPIGFVGDTGAFTGTHLHVTYGASDINLGTAKNPDYIADGSAAHNPGPPVYFAAFGDSQPADGQTIIGDNSQIILLGQNVVTHEAAHWT
jgi:murein DD-endopeptidase MepM/ murein hydrolase activator NlpD